MLAPAMSAAVAVHTSNGTAILLIVIQLFLSTALITTPQPLRPSSFLLTTHALLSFGTLHSLNCDFPLPIRPQLRQEVTVLVTLPEHVLQIVVDDAHRVGFFLPPRTERLLNVPNFILARFPIAEFPLSRCSATLRSPHKCTAVPSVRGAIEVSGGPNVRFVISPLVGLCATECFTLIIATVTKISFAHRILASLSLCHSTLPLVPIPRLSCPRRIPDCATVICVSIAYDCLGSAIIFKAFVFLPPYRTSP